jgi:hypothetical protein
MSKFEKADDPALFNLDFLVVVTTEENKISVKTWTADGFLLFKLKDLIPSEGIIGGLAVKPRMRVDITL